MINLCEYIYIERSVRTYTDIHTHTIQSFKLQQYTQRYAHTKSSMHKNKIKADIPLNETYVQYNK